MLATRIQASAEAIVFSKSLASRQHRNPAAWDGKPPEKLDGSINVPSDA